MKSLVIAEKPSVARDIARVLGANQKNGGILEGKNYVVTWALGHLVTLADPEEYDRKYEKWEMATLPMLPKEMSKFFLRDTLLQAHFSDCLAITNQNMLLHYLTPPYYFIIMCL